MQPRLAFFQNWAVLFCWWLCQTYLTKSRENVNSIVKIGNWGPHKSLICKHKTSWKLKRSCLSNSIIRNIIRVVRSSFPCFAGAFKLDTSYFLCEKITIYWTVKVSLFTDINSRYFNGRAQRDNIMCES